MVVKYLKKGTTFYIRTSSDSKWISNENLGKSMSLFDFRKLIKIDRNLYVGRKSNLEHFSFWQLLPNLHTF
jgi:hypothetical protein